MSHLTATQTGVIQLCTNKQHHCHWLLRWDFSSPQMTAILGFFPLRWFMWSQGPKRLSANWAKLLQKGSKHTLLSRASYVSPWGVLNENMLCISVCLSVQVSQLEGHWTLQTYRHILALLESDNNNGHVARITTCVSTHIWSVTLAYLDTVYVLEQRVFYLICVETNETATLSVAVCEIINTLKTNINLNCI
jgi:hypothetical protein